MTLAARGTALLSVFLIMVTRRRESTFTIAGVAITHPERVIAQAPELTKLDIVRLLRCGGGGHVAASA